MFFPKAQPLQWLCFSSCTWGNPMTVCLKCFSAPWCKCAILLCHNSLWLLLLLLTRAFAGSKCNLYTFSLLLPITRSKLLSDPLGLIYTLWSRNFTWYPLSFRVEIDIRFLVTPGTYNTLAKLRGLQTPSKMKQCQFPVPDTAHHHPAQRGSLFHSPASLWRISFVQSCD